jgi:hypothetical protein
MEVMVDFEICEFNREVPVRLELVHLLSMLTPCVSHPLSQFPMSTFLGMNPLL